MCKKTLLAALLLNSVLFAAFNLYRLYPDYLFSQGWIVSGTRLAPWAWQYHLFVGNEMARRKEYGRAGEYYLKALRWAPYLAVVANNLALSQAAQGKRDLARAIYLDVLAFDPGNPDALRGLHALTVMGGERQ